MMKLVYKINLAVLLIAGIASSVRADGLDRREFSKTIKKEFDITATGTTAIYNKYGTVEIKTWDRNRVKVDVKIIVNASNEGEAQRVFDRININFYNKSNYVKAETEIESVKKTWWESWSGSDTKSDYTVNYEVYLPASNNLELGNRYGDTYIANLSGKVNVSVKYGNIKMQNIGNTASITLAYGNGSVLSAKNMTGDISYAKFICGEADNVEITSKSSRLRFDKVNNIISITKNDTYEIEEVNEFKNEGKYDNFTIGTAQDIIIISKYTQLKVNNIGNLLDLNMGYGGASVGNVSKNFSSINLVGSHTDYKLVVDPGTNYRLDAAANFGGIYYPSAMQVSYEKERGTEHEVKGHLGGQSARGTITARLEHGGLTVKQE